MERDDGKDSKWMSDAVKLPTRNRHPPGRHPVDSILMVTNNCQPRVSPLPPGHASLYQVKGAIPLNLESLSLTDTSSRPLRLTSQNLALAPVTRRVIAQDMAAKDKENKTEISFRLSSAGDGGSPDTQDDQVLRTGAPLAENLAFKNTINIDRSCDVRNEIGPPHKLEAIEGVIHKDPWMGEGDDDAHFMCQSYNSRFINAWLLQVPEDIRADFLGDSDIEEHSEHPINTDTGTLMARVEQPESTRNPETLRPDHKKHADRWTSNYHIKSKIMIRERDAALMQQKQATPVSFHGCESNIQPVPQREVAVDCVLRPAKPNDVPGIIDIYNREIKKGHRALDSELVSENDLNAIGNSCRTQCLPFIVAMRQSPDLTDPSVWPSKSAWETFMQMPQKPVPQPPLVIGFAFCETLKVGFGKGGHVGQQSVRLHVYTHHDYRRKNDNASGMKPYDNPTSRSRMVPQRIIIEGIFRDEKDPELTFIRKWLNAFRFEEVGRIQGAYGTKRGPHNSEWMDLHIWQHQSCEHEHPTGSDPGVWEGGLLERY
ncbi:Forkhead box protein J2 [Verticillium dahliae VDG1]|nr:Forkhead box protein J2 [Verticillium dahliae VDG1]